MNIGCQDSSNLFQNSHYYPQLQSNLGPRISCSRHLTGKVLPSLLLLTRLKSKSKEEMCLIVNWLLP